MKAPGASSSRSARLTLVVSLMALAAVAALAPPAWADGPADHARQAEVARQQRAHEAAVLVARGRKLLNERAYAEAREAFEEALRLQPDDPACRRLLRQAEAALGVGSASSVLDGYKEERATITQSVLRQLHVDLFEAERELETNPERAIQLAQRVLEGMAAVDDAPAAADMRQKAQAVLTKARAEHQSRLAERRGARLVEAKAHAQRVAEAEATRLGSLRAEGWQHLDHGDYDKALEVAEAILREDAANRDALKLKDEARLARLAAGTLRGKSKARREAEDSLQAQIERELMPNRPAEIVLPGKAKGAARGLETRPMEAWERDLRTKLERSVVLEFRETPLAQAVAQIGDAAGLNVIIDPEADTRKVPVTITRSPMPAGSWLRWVARFGGLDLSVRDGAVVLAKRGGTLDEPVTRVYDISSLVTPPNEARPLAFVGPIEPTEHPTESAPLPKPDPDLVGNRWVTYIRNTVEPGSWERALQEEPRYTIAYRNGRIVVVHTPEVHEQIEDLLNNFRRARSLQVHVLARFVEVSSAFLDSFRLDLTSYDSDPFWGQVDPVTLEPLDQYKWHATGRMQHLTEVGALTRFPNFFQGGGGLRLEYDYLGSDDVSALLEAVIKKRQGTVLTAPRITCFNTQRANLQVLVNHNYVRRVTSDNEPEIGNIPEGMIFDVQPFVSADHRYITLILQPQMRELVEIVEFHFSTEAEEFEADGAVVLILQESIVQLPTTRLRSIGTTVTVPNGGTLLMGGFTEVEERSGHASVPLLEGIPLLGRLLRGWDRSEGRRSLIILVTAETVPDIFEE